MSKTDKFLEAISIALPDAIVIQNKTGYPMVFGNKGHKIVVAEFLVSNGEIIGEDWAEPVKSWDTFEANCEALVGYSEKLYSHQAWAGHTPGSLIITVRESQESKLDGRGVLKRQKVLRIGMWLPSLSPVS